MSHAPDDYALVIGINGYPEWNKGAKSLNGSVKDATDFRDWLIHKDGGGLDPDNAKLIVSSDKPLGPRQWMIDDAFREIRNQSEGKTRRRFYFYFSGHGHSRAGSWQQQSLCLANWSPVDAGAALHLESYIKASIGCLKFSEAVFLLDCCRVRAVVPLGQQSELECGDPDARDRYSAIMFGADQYEPTFEGEVDEEIRGYFTTALLKVLEEGTIELGELLRRVRDIVPDLSRPKKQTVRAVPADKDIFLGPPGRKPPPEKFAGGGTEVEISTKSNLTGRNAPEDAPPPKTGDITILRDDKLVDRGLGVLRTSLLPGRYEVRIDHAEASITHMLEVGDQPLSKEYELPRRASATLLSSTIDKHEWLTDPVVAASTWDAGEDQQAVFITMRPRSPGEAPGLTGDLYLRQHDQTYPVDGPAFLQPVGAGMLELRYDDPDGQTSVLPVPVAKGWDTQVFMIVSNGAPLLATASVSMRPAGAGFDPSDALVDAYERGIADLVTGGPGPDRAMLDSLLWGKYRNPLFGLLGAHFLIRELRRKPDSAGLERLALVTHNLGELLGADAPDIAALRLWRQLLAKEDPTETLSSDVPLFSVGFQAFIEATAVAGAAPARGFDEVALTLDANSPWTLWRPQADEQRALGWHSFSTNLSTLDAASTSVGRLLAVERLWRGEGFAIEASQDEDIYKLRATRTGEPGFNIVKQANTLLRVPDWLVSYLRQAIEQSERTGEPLDPARIVRRTVLPMNVILAAKALAEHDVGQSDQADARLAIEPGADSEVAEAAAVARARGPKSWDDLEPSEPVRRREFTGFAGKEAQAEDDEDEGGEMSAGAV